MSKEIIANGDIETEKHKSYHCKNLILLEDVDIDILVSSMISSNEKNYKYSISYKDDNNYKIKPLHIMLPKMSAYVKTYDGKTIWMNFFLKDDELLKKYNDI